MVDFFYSTSYDDDIPKEAEQETISLLQLHARMFALGDRGCFTINLLQPRMKKSLPKSLSLRRFVNNLRQKIFIWRLRELCLGSNFGGCTG
jgi:hypothetical protein